MSVANGFNTLEQARAVAVPNRLQDKIASGLLAHSCSVKFIKNIEVVQMIAVAGYDAVLIDLEHGSLGLDTANQLSVAALSAGICPIVRVPGNASDWISRALDGGCQAVIVPHVNTAAEAERVVRYARFAPLGERSATGGMPILRYASVDPLYANQVCNEKATVICMIESRKGVENVEAIAAVPGVDILLVGHGDLTQDFGIPGQYDDTRIADAFGKIAAAAKKASVNGRTVTVGLGGLHGRPDLQRKLAEKYDNVRYAMSGSDNGFLLSALISGGKISAGVTQAVADQH